MKILTVWFFLMLWLIIDDWWNIQWTLSFHWRKSKHFNIIIFDLSEFSERFHIWKWYENFIKLHNWIGPRSAKRRTRALFNKFWGKNVIFIFEEKDQMFFFQTQQTACDKRFFSRNNFFSNFKDIKILDFLTLTNSLVFLAEKTVL